MQFSHILRSALFQIFLPIWTVCITTFCLPTLLTRNKKIISLTASVWSKVTIYAVKLICGIKYKEIGAAHLPDEPFIIVSKHESMWETVYLMYRFNKPVFILKEELTKIPFYGWYLRWMGMIAIKREDGVKSIKHIISESKIALADNRSLIIFPEGTRVKPGQIADIQPGIAALYNALEVPIIAFSIDSGNYWPKDNWIKRPGIINVIISEPIVDRKLSRKDFLKEIQKKINIHNQFTSQDVAQ